MAIAAFLSGGTAVASAAQTITGSVSDAASGQPLPQVQVQLLTPQNGRVAETVTDQQGRFLLRGRAGVFIVSARSLGYAETLSDTVRLSTNEVVYITVRMSERAIPLDPVTVTARSRAFHDLSYDGLYARRAHAPPVGNFRVWVKGDRDFESAIKAGDLLLQMKPRRIDYTANQPRRCTPIVFRQGFLVRGGMGELWLETSPDNLEGIEIYRDWHSLPLDVRMQLEKEGPRLVRECGVVALWMRRPDYPRR